MHILCFCYYIYALNVKLFLLETRLHLFHVFNYFNYYFIARIFDLCCEMFYIQ